MVCNAIAGSAAVLTHDIQSLNLSASAEYLEDPAGTLKLEDVQSGSHSFRPWTELGTHLNFGFTASAYWIRIPLQRFENAQADWLLSVSYSHLQHLDFYAPGQPVLQTGSERPLNSRVFYDRHFVFPLHVDTGKSHYYIRATSRYALTVPLILWEPNAYRAQQHRFHALQFLYFGGFFVLSLLGLVIYLAIRNSLFAIYSAYISSAGFGILSGNGYGRLFLWPNSPLFDEVSQSLFLSFTAYCAAWFARRLTRLSMESLLGKCLFVSQVLFGLVFVLTLLQLMLPFLLRPANQILMINGVVLGLLVTLAGFYGLKQKISGVRFFLAGWIVLWIGACVATLRAFGWMPSTGLTSYAVQITMAVDMLLVALALGDLLREEHKAYITTQQKALEANQSLLEMSQASEQKLKQAVQERTEQLQASLDQEKHLREQYVRIGSMISHEFRTPLSIIQAQASLMRKEYENGIDEVKKRLQAIGGATDRLKLMFDKWLYSDALNETLEMLDLKPLDLDVWLQELLETHTHLLPNHKVDLKISMESVIIMADEYHLDLAISNLIDNATKYAPAQSTITIETRSKAGFVGLAVTDQGPGIPLEAQDKVFKEFFRVTPESQIRGVGLGLSIVQRIVHAHKGHVTLDSTPGRGATFCIWIPTDEVRLP